MDLLLPKNIYDFILNTFTWNIFSIVNPVIMIIFYIIYEAA